MLELTYVSLLFIALSAAKIGAIDRRAELLVYPTSMAFFAAFAVASFSVRPSFGSGSPVQHLGMAALGVGGTLLMLVLTILAALDRLPEPTEQMDSHPAQ